MGVAGSPGRAEMPKTEGFAGEGGAEILAEMGGHGGRDR